MLTVTTRTAVLTFFSLLMVLILLVLVVHSSNTQSHAVQEKGESVTRMYAQLLQAKLEHFFLEPLRIQEVFAQILQPELENFTDFSQLTQKTSEYLSIVQNDLPQIQVFAFGDKFGNSYGLQVNTDQTLSLILKDSRTLGQLHLYSGPTTETELTNLIPDYDPRTRPWYTPVVQNPQPQWSRVYANVGGIEEKTISYLIPVFLATQTPNELYGVFVMDIRLDEISRFLRAEMSRSGGQIVILDEAREPVAHSANRISPELIDLYTEQLGFLESNQTTIPDPQVVYADGQRYFLYGVPVDPIIGLDWTIHILLPIAEIVGDLQQYQKNSLVILALILTGFAGIGAVGIGFIIHPFKQGAEAALQLIAGEDGDTSLVYTPFKESQDLSQALRKLGWKLRQSAQEVRISEEKYRYLVENFIELFYTMDPGGTIVSVNRGVEIMIDQPRENLLGKSVYSIIPPSAELEMREAISNVLKAKTKIQFQVRFLSSEKNDKTFNTTLIPILDDSGTVTLIVGTSYDISDLILAQEAVARLTLAENDRLQSLVEEKTNKLQQTMQELFNREKMASLGEMVGGFSHEINSPLGVALTASTHLGHLVEDFVSRVDQDGLTKTEFRSRVDSIQETTEMVIKNLNRAADLITSFKALSVNQSLDEVVHFDLHSTIQSVIVSLGHEIKRSRVVVDFQCPKPLLIRGLPGQYSQIISNFIMNSLIHGFEDVPSGNITIHIGISNKGKNQDESDIIVTYGDDGKGMTADQVKKIFEPFFTTKRDRGGTGLGLSIVYNIVSGALGGTIECRSQPGRGTEFILTIPQNGKSEYNSDKNQ